MIIDQQKNPIVGATVQVLEFESRGVLSDINGKFNMPLVAGNYTIQTSFVGFEKNIISVTIRANQTTKVTVMLKEDVDQLSEVIVEGKTQAEQAKEKAFEVEVVELKGLKNSSADMNTVLATIPGINVRQQGGLGSEFNFSINGLSDKQIKFFVDGVPFENLGSSLTFNNYPTTLIDRIEVYKGVVPIALGSDALGGAVNLITSSSRKNYLDTSYDTGSFGTHRTTVNGQYFFGKDIFLKLTSFYNYSENDYKIDGIEVRDALGNNTGEVRDNIRRFHDGYTSQMLQLKAGIVDQSFADRLEFSFMTSANKNEIQHPLDPQEPFGEVFTKNKVYNTSVFYENKALFDDKLRLKIYASLSENAEKVVDTSSRLYNWFGTFTEKSNKGLGELSGSKTLFEFEDQLHLINTFLVYKTGVSTALNFNYTKNYIKRVGTDSFSNFPIPFENPNTLDKNIISLAFDWSLFDRSWSTTVFVKRYFLNSKVFSEDAFLRSDDPNRLKEITKSSHKMGYGFASTYKLPSLLQVKTSFERTYRIPEGSELFGNGLLLRSNPELQPEESYNANLGFLVTTEFNKLRLQSDINLFYRDSKDFISIRSVGITSIFRNVASANSSGVEGALNVRYNEKLFLDVNATYQNIVNKNADDSFGLEFLEKQRIPNIPYLFGNLRLGGDFKNVFIKEDGLTLSLSSYYVKDFPRDSFTNGAVGERFVIPQQLSYNTEIGYAVANGTYNIAFQVRNLTDAKVFDNFDIQQPGRAFYIKLRYFLEN